MAYQNIKVQKGLSIIRKRPGQFIGDFLNNEYNSGLMNILREIIGNSVDEFLAGYCKEIVVSLNEELNQVSVRDYGRGIPISLNEEEGVSNLQLATGKMYSGAKYDKLEEGSDYTISIGMNGIGLTCTNALSSQFNAYSFRDGLCGSIYYSKGELTKEFAENRTGEKDGTLISWVPDQEILPFKYKVELIKRFLQESAYLNAGLRILFIVAGSTHVFYEPRGIESFLNSVTLNKKILVGFPIFTGTSSEGNLYRVALKILESSSEEYRPYVNGNLIEESSTPVIAIRQAFARAVSKYINQFADLKKKDKNVEIHPRDVRSGVTAVIKILHVNPLFDAQTKTKLINTDIAHFIKKDLADKFLVWLLNNHTKATTIVKQVLIQARARIAAVNARKQVISREKRVFQNMSISLDIFTPPLSRDSSQNKLYLFEGLSASGSLTQAGKNKDPETGKLYKEHIGILALKGLTKNCLELPISKAIKNTELSTLIEVAGLNYKNPDDLSKLNFNDFVIATDADAGGDHICSLLVIFFLTYFPEIIKQGKLCRIITPLYELKDLKNKQIYFIYAEESLEERIVYYGYVPSDINKTFILKRNKGLGEMSKESNLTLVRDPILKYLKVKDIEEMRKLFYVFSGKKYVQERKSLIFKLGLE